MYDWPEKIIYNVDIPNEALSVGSSTRINFRFIPLLKGLKLGTIETRLIETHHVTKPSPATRSREVLIDEYKPPPWDELDIVPSDDEHTYYSYHFSRILRPPKSTKHCLQSTTTTNLQVKHKIAVLITLLNPDGHMSSVGQPFLLGDMNWANVHRSVSPFRYLSISARRLVCRFRHFPTQMVRMQIMGNFHATKVTFTIRSQTSSVYPVFHRQDIYNGTIIWSRMRIHHITR